MENYDSGLGAYAKLTVLNTTTNTEVDTATTVTSPDLSNVATGKQDTDGDGIPDAWELAHGLNASVNDAAKMSNSSGISNLQAYQSGLNPWTLEEVSKLAASDKPLPPPVQPPSATETSASLSWTAPLTRLDGSSISLSEIEHYEIHYGRDRNNMDQTVTVGGDQSSYAISNLPAGIWYFTVTVVDSNNRVSAPSEVVSKTI